MADESEKGTTFYSIKSSAQYHFDELYLKCTNRTIFALAVGDSSTKLQKSAL